MPASAARDRPVTPWRMLLSLVLLTLWVTAAVLLWRSSVVPAGLHLDGVDVHRYFGQQLLARTERFGRFLTWTQVAALLATLLAAAAIARWGELWAGASLAGPVGSGTLLGMVGVAVLWLVGLPFSVLELWWERRHGLARTGYLQALFGDWAALAFEFALISLALLVVMTLARRLGERWWLPAAPIFTGLVLLYVLVQPWLLPTHSLHDRRLAAAARVLERREGTGPVAIRVQKVSTATSAPNAEAVGVGPSTRVVLWDTLLDKRFTEREVRVVLAHELGHVARSHIWKGVAWSGLALVPLLALLARGTRRRGGMGTPEAVPLALLIAVGFQIVALPAENLVSRHIEQEADWMALQAARDPAAQTQLFQGFARTSLQEPRPGLLEYALFETHPTLIQRIALVDAWRARQRG